MPGPKAGLWATAAIPQAMAPVQQCAFVDFRLSSTSLRGAGYEATKQSIAAIVGVGAGLFAVDSV